MFFTGQSLYAQSNIKPAEVGFLGSLTGFAGQYGNSVLEGARLASDKNLITLHIEDDKSSPKDLAIGYKKLVEVDKVSVIIGASWWMNSIIKQAEKDKVILLSCETLFNREFVQSPYHFSLLGDLADWISVYDSLIQEQGWKKAALIKFVSGFADTIKDELTKRFSSPGKQLNPVLEYSDFELSQAAQFATLVKNSSADFLYIDAQPQSYAVVVKKLSDQKVSIPILGYSVAQDALNQKLFDPKIYPGRIFFTKRAPPSDEFILRYSKEYGKPPVLDSDVGFIAMSLIKRSIEQQRELREFLLSQEHVVDQQKVKFDARQVNIHVSQALYEILKTGEVARMR